jgi:hypothetical protein
MAGKEFLANMWEARGELGDLPDDGAAAGRRPGCREGPLDPDVGWPRGGGLSGVCFFRELGGESVFGGVVGAAGRVGGRPPLERAPHAGYGRGRWRSRWALPAGRGLG